MESARPQAVIFAEAPKALTQVCGVSLLERLLRILRRLDFRQATIVSSTPDRLRNALEPPTWARRGLEAQIVLPNEINFRKMKRLLILPGDFYYDPRLIGALLNSPRSAQLIDSAPPSSIRPLLVDCRSNGSGWLSGAAVLAPSELESLAKGELGALDAANVPAYVRGMRRHVRPVFFPAPTAERQSLAKRIVFDSAQKGTLDIPAILQSPVEDWVLHGLCRTTITPNQITLFGFVVAMGAAALFATGHLWWGMIPALAIGVIDGLDGKQARVKVETTPSGHWEHCLDFVFEMSWWSALAWWFQRSGQLPSAWGYWGLIVGSELVDLLAKLVAHQRLNCALDDYAPFDRAFRLIAARRDVYLWTIAVGLLFGAAAQAYAFCAWWGVFRSVVHVVRTLMVVRPRIVKSRIENR